MIAYLEQCLKAAIDGTYQNGNYVVIEGEVISNKKVTTTEATNILSNIYECKWTPVTEKLLLVASQLGITLR